MPAPRKYPQELRERAQRLVAEAREQEPELSLTAERGGIDGVLAGLDRLSRQFLHRRQRIGGLVGPAPLAGGCPVGDALQFAQDMSTAELVLAGVGVVGPQGVVHGEPAESWEHPEGVDPGPPPPRVAATPGVLAGTGAVHPVQLAPHGQPGLVEADHPAAGQLIGHPVQELTQPPGGPAGDVGYRARRHRGAEQLGQRLGSALLGQEPAQDRYTMIAATRGP
jgi:hypothetical protein